MSQKTIIYSSQAASPVGPYSQAVKAGGFVFVSGMIALNLEGTLVNADIQSETRQVLHNLEVILKEAGIGFDKVVKCSIFLNDMNNFQAVNEVYAGVFASNPPARETVEVSRLPKDVNVEISCIALAD